MTREEFKNKAKEIIDSESFGPLKMFNYDNIDDIKIAYIPDESCFSEADMPIMDFLDELYDAIKGE